MILHMGGGGANGLAIDILGGTAQPSGVANRIWLKTETAIGKVTVENAAPASPVAGDVHIEIDPASSAVMQLGKGSRIVRLPLGIASQYQSGTWVPLDGYAYLSDAWAPFSTDIPDGDTTTPDDTNTWLRCAGINPSAVGNPTLAQVVASAALCATLMGSANAINYLIRSATIQTSVLGSATALAALNASSPFVSVQMTSNNAPTGYAATHSNSAYQANAFNLTNPNSPYQAVVYGAGTGIYVVVDIPTAIWPYKFNLSWYSNYNENYVACSMKIQGSVDGGSTWVDLMPSTQLTGLNTVISTFIALPGAARYSKYRAIITASAGGTLGAWGFKVYGKSREVVA